MGMGMGMDGGNKSVSFQGTAKPPRRIVIDPFTVLLCQMVHGSLCQTVHVVLTYSAPSQIEPFDVSTVLF
jgi:hypothetical protein